MRMIMLALMAAVPIAARADTLTITDQVSVLSNPQAASIAQSVAGGGSGFGYNRSAIVQSGSGNTASTEQMNNNNTVSTNQSGSNNFSNVQQFGAYGTVTNTQSGNNLGITVTQTGNAPSIVITQHAPR